MKKETLFEAMSGVGDDLLVMAEEKKFVNPWQKWGQLAAIFAVVLCAGLVAAPYLIHHGDQETKEEKPAAVAQLRADEGKPDASGSKPGTQQLDSSGGQRPEVQTQHQTEEALNRPEENGTDVEIGQEAMAERFVCRGTYYYIRPASVDSSRINVGEELGTVTDATKEELVGCSVYAVPYSTWFTNFAVNGETVTQEVYILTPSGYRYAVTANEKVISRYTMEDIAAAIKGKNLQWFADQFVVPVERVSDPDFTAASELSVAQLHELLWAGAQMNTGVDVSDCWLNMEGKYVIPAGEARWRLNRFLTGFRYDPTRAAEYNEEYGTLVFDEEPDRDEVQIEVLEAEKVGSNKLRLVIVRDDGKETRKEYVIRFDEDSWRYESICVIEE